MVWALPNTENYDLTIPCPLPAPKEKHRATPHVLCGLPNLSIYSNITERKPRGLQNITKKSKALAIWPMVSGVSASCAVARTGWGVYKPLPGLRVLLLSTSNSFQVFINNARRSQVWRGLRTDRKEYQACGMLRRCAGTATARKKRKQGNNMEGENGVHFSQKARNCIHDWERVGLAKIVPTTKWRQKCLMMRGSLLLPQEARGM